MSDKPPFCQPKNKDDARDCTQCFGTGDCPACVGAFLDKDFGDRDLACANCDGTGYCPDCDGAGYY